VRFDLTRLITQHRRGTTEEWNESSIILSDGEIVVENCDDGTSKLKVGDGKHSFKDLPYITRKIDNEIVVLDSRMNNFTKLPDGSTSGDAELADIRVGYDGVIYENAGQDYMRQVTEDKQ